MEFTNDQLWSLKYIQVDLPERENTEECVLAVSGSHLKYPDRGLFFPKNLKNLCKSVFTNSRIFKGLQEN